MKYIKEFENHSQYEAYTASTEFVTPNVSYCNEENEVHYNPYVPPVESFKYKLTLSDTSVVSAECDATSAITSAETSAYSSTTVAAEIGDCVTTIGQQAFKNCTNLTSINIPSSVTSIGSSAFINCTSLTSVTIPSGVTTIGIYTFYKCTSLTSIDIPSGVTNINNMAFQNCSGLTSITVNAVTPPTLGTMRVFDDTNNCPIYVPCESVNAYKAASGWSTYASRIQCVAPPQPTTALTYAASSKLNVNLTKFTPAATAETFASGVGTIEFASDVTAIGDSVFKDYTRLTSIDIPNSVTSIGGSAFWGCSGLTSCTIPSGVTNIGYAAFLGCTSLTSCTIPNSVTSIGNVAFAECSGLTSCTIGSGVTSIGEMAFQNCSGLESITVNATTPPTLGDYAFYNTNNCPIYVPAASVDVYKSTEIWEDDADRIQAKP